MSRTELTLPEVSAAVHQVLEGAAPRVAIGEVHGSAAALYLLALRPFLRRPLLVVTARESAAADLQLDLQMLGLDQETYLLPELLEGERKSPEVRRNRSDRERTLAAFRRAEPADVLLSSLRALAEPTADPKEAEEATTELTTGERVDRDQLRHLLFEAGLEPAPLVCHPGEMSVRGDIIDYFAWGSTGPVRLEFFDDELESIRQFDVESQRSRGALEKIAVARTRRRKLAQGSTPFHALDHLAGDVLIASIDPTAIQMDLERSLPSVHERRAALERLAAMPCIELYPEFQSAADLALGARPIEGCHGVEKLSRWAAALDPSIRHLHLFSSTAAEGKRLVRHLREALPASPRRAVIDHRGSLSSGFSLPACGMWMGNHHELLSRIRLRRVENEATLPMRSVAEALELSAGDHVVHQTHGIGLYRGIKRHQQEGGTEDYLILEFDEGTLLYVPASKIDLLSRYIGAGASAPKLDRIGGKSWANKKERVSRALDEVSEELLEVHAHRKSRPGHAFAVDDELQVDFEASFPYADTQDQVNTCEEIKRDMEAPRAMDRLVCGDVGFGKTELAVRAAFKAATQGKQVAVLAPTTLLVRQHLETFRGRMADYPLRVESLSRLVAGKHSGEVLSGLRSGTVDIVIGTHRLLTSGIEFKDLGLLVIDEEQRFGVKHKEALKKLRSTVDVLTLSATPIPRTLHMALVGLRDISTLREPPRGRQAVETRVTYHDEELIRTAIHRELEREGQTFYLFNRVAPIEQVAARVQALVPHARIGVAHGQMPTARLEKMATALQEGKLDVLVCTTIVESGLDLPRVNTLVVDRADRMGLADLHQLRGRVGRSNRKAYAYFLIPRKPLPAIARKRLRALEGLSHLGAGFDLAIRDLEIRGAGNLLGQQQSGHIASVGYELYCRLLARAISRRRGKKPPPEPEEIDLSLGLPAFLPREYIHSTHQRMGLMRRLGEARGLSAIAELEEEIIDRFGRTPPPVRHLLDLFRLKDYCRRHGLARVFYPGASEILLNVRDLKSFGRAPKGNVTARWVKGGRVVLVLPPRVRTPLEVLEYLKEEWLPGQKSPRASVECADAGPRARRTPARQPAPPFPDSPAPETVPRRNRRTRRRNTR